MNLVFYPMVLGMESIQSDDVVPHHPAPHYDCLFYSYVCLIINPRSILACKNPKIDEIECGSSLYIFGDAANNQKIWGQVQCKQNRKYNSTDSNIRSNR